MRVLCLCVLDLSSVKRRKNYHTPSKKSLSGERGAGCNKPNWKSRAPIWRTAFGDVRGRKEKGGARDGRGKRYYSDRRRRLSSRWPIYSWVGVNFCKCWVQLKVENKLCSANELFLSFFLSFHVDCLFACVCEGYKFKKRREFMRHLCLRLAGPHLYGSLFVTPINLELGEQKKIIGISVPSCFRCDSRPAVWE